MTIKLNVKTTVFTNITRLPNKSSNRHRIIIKVIKMSVNYYTHYYVPVTNMQIMNAQTIPKNIFEMRHEIDQKNKVLFHIARNGVLWDKFGECSICGKESQLRCKQCPSKFYCSKDHHKLCKEQSYSMHQCMSVIWNQDIYPKARKNLEIGTEILEKSTIFVAPRFHTASETALDFDRFSYDGYLDEPLRPCFGYHELIPRNLSNVLVCSICKFPVHNFACQTSEWHKDECEILQRLCIQSSWYHEIGKREDIMIHLAVLRGILYKKFQPLVYDQIMNLDSTTGPFNIISEYLKISVVRFIKYECRLNWIEANEIVKFLSIYWKHRINCDMACSDTKKMVQVICKGGIPFTLVKGQTANIQGGVYNYRMRMIFRTIIPVKKGECLTIGHIGSSSV